MIKQGGKFWIGLAVGILGLVVGASNLMRGGFGDVVNTRHVVTGTVCIVLATAWLLYLLLRLLKER